MVTIPTLSVLQNAQECCKHQAVQQGERRCQPKSASSRKRGAASAQDHRHSGSKEGQVSPVPVVWVTVLLGQVRG